MAHSAKSPATSPASYHGEVWTDARGYATVRLPAEAGPLEPPLEYELRDPESPSSARVTAELRNGRFTIATNQPHVKVTWRITGQSRAGDRRLRQAHEED